MGRLPIFISWLINQYTKDSKTLFRENVNRIVAILLTFRKFPAKYAMGKEKTPDRGPLCIGRFYYQECGTIMMGYSLGVMAPLR
jgi:hypothetical protein